MLRKTSLFNGKIDKYYSLKREILWTISSRDLEGILKQETKELFFL